MALFLQFGESSHSETGKYRKLEEDSPSDEEDGDQEGKGDADDETAVSIPSDLFSIKHTFIKI